MDEFFPMLCNHDNVIVKFGDPNYLMQRKYDGTRCVLHKSGNSVKMIGRSNKNDYSPFFPEIVAEAKRLPDVSVDCELAFFDKNGKDVFLTALAKPGTKSHLLAKLMVFDVTCVNGKSTTNLPIESRIEVVEMVIKGFNHIEAIKTYRDPSQYASIYDEIVKSGGEGVVLKKKGSPYIQTVQNSSRPYWTKVKKVNTADCIVSGITVGKGARETLFGALILSQYDKDGKLVRVGNTSGFDTATMIDLYNRVMSLPGIPQNGDKDVKKYVPPEIVVEVKFMNRTESGYLRFPAFLRIRTDKSPKECVVDLMGYHDSMYVG